MSDPYTDELIAMNRHTAKLYRDANGLKKTPRKKNKSRFEYKKQMKRCKYCKSTENLTVDHKIPLILGGKDELSNWQCLCKQCNTMKSSLTDGQVKSLFKWFLRIQADRVAKGKKPYILK